MKLSVLYIGKDVEKNDSQWHLAITEISKTDPAIIATKFSNSIHCAVYGWDDNDANFDFPFDEDKDEWIPDLVKKQLLKHPKALQRIIKTGIFNK